YDGVLRLAEGKKRPGQLFSLDYAWSIVLIRLISRRFPAIGCTIKGRSSEGRSWQGNQELEFEISNCTAGNDGGQLRNFYGNAMFELNPRARLNCVKLWSPMAGLHIFLSCLVGCQ
ncbi:hypothetical protein AMTR_s00103p00142220, partial [Amborella trichopoda]